MDVQCDMVLYKKKKNPKQRPKSGKNLSTAQERIYLRVLLFIVVVCLLWLLLAPGSGVISLFTKRSELHHVQQETQRTAQENKALEGDINNLLNDPQFLEEVARQNYNLLKKNEKVFDFSKKSEKSKE
jgi:cell division protein FtsB